MKDFFVFGSYSKEEILAVAHATRRHTKQNNNLFVKKNNKEFKRGYKNGSRSVNSNWSIKRTVFIALIFQIVAYLFNMVIKPPHLYLFIRSEIIKWLGEIDDTAPGPQPSPPIQKGDIVFALIWILYILIDKQ